MGIGSSVALFFFLHCFLLSSAMARRGYTWPLMQDYAKAFYKSKAWQQCRDAYMHSVCYLCENCRRKGILKTGDTVHHKVHLTPENIGDPAVTLSWSNLELVCRDCHAELHKTNRKRYIVRDDGRVEVPPFENF